MGLGNFNFRAEVIDARLPGRSSLARSYQTMDFFCSAGESWNSHSVR